MDAVKHDSLEMQAVLQRMERVRRELDEDVQEIVEGARIMGKWRYYVRTYPWLCAGIALLGGYLIVPRLHRPASEAPASSHDLEPDLS